MPVNLLLQFLDGPLGELGSGLGLLQLGGQGLDLFLVGLLTLVGLLLGHLQGLQVVADNAQLLLQLHDLGLAGLGTLLSALKLALNLGQLLGDLVVLFVSVLSLVPCLLQLVLKLGHALLVLDGAVFQHLAHTLGVVGGGGGFVELLGGDQQLVLALLQVLLKTLHTSVQGIDLELSGEESLLLLLELLVGGLVQVNLQLLGLLDQLGHLLLGLLGADLGVLGGLLAGVGAVHRIVLLHLHGLHLLLDRVHDSV